VIGSLDHGQISAEFAIDIERPDSPNAISVDRDQLELSVGDNLPIQVFGVYGDCEVPAQDADDSLSSP
jgi:hypothetical protein